MNSKPLFSDLAYPVVWPTLVALVVATILIIERNQLDWAADCTLTGTCAAFDSRMGAAWLPAAFAFGLAHVAGAFALPFRHQPTLIMRGTRLLIYAVVHFVPFFGAYIFVAGLVFGYATAFTIVGLPIALPVGALGGGVAAGVCLALAAGPSFKATTGWRTVLTRYACGSAFSTAVLVLGSLIFDPSVGHLLGPEEPWATAFVTLLCIGIACTIGWTIALSIHWPFSSIVTSPAYRAALATMLAASVTFALVAHQFIKNELTVFPKEPEWTATVATYIREKKPRLNDPVQLGGMRFLGDRSTIIAREKAFRGEMMSETREKGTDQETNVFWTVEKSYMQWRLAYRDSVNPTEPLYVVADNGGILLALWCAPESTDCERVGIEINRGNKIERTRAVSLDTEDAYHFDGKSPGAALAIRYDETTRGEGSKPERWRKIYCRLNVLDVTPADFSVSQVISCETDWKAEAQKVRTYVESLFTKDLSGNVNSK